MRIFFLAAIFLPPIVNYGILPLFLQVYIYLFLRSTIFPLEGDLMKNILLEQFSPLCEIQAFVEEDESGVYFYLWIFPDRNTPTSAPAGCETTGQPRVARFFRDGRRPCAHAAARLLCASVWGGKARPGQTVDHLVRGGDAAALLYEDEVLAVIPGWAGQGPDGASYPAYARDCIAESPLCFPLGTPDTNALFARIESARQFWASWDEHPWPELQHQYLDAITSALGPVKNYYGIDGGHWPPKALVTIEKGEVTYAVTLGVSIVPQPKVEQYTESPERCAALSWLLPAKRNGWLKMNSSFSPTSAGKRRFPGRT